MTDLLSGVVTEVNSTLQQNKQALHGLFVLYPTDGFESTTELQAEYALTNRCCSVSANRFLKPRGGARSEWHSSKDMD